MRSHGKNRSGWFWAILAAVALIAVMAAGLGLYMVGRSNADTVYTYGNLGQPDRVALRMSIKRIDAATQTAAIEVDVTPLGALAGASGYFTSDAVLLMPTAAKSDPVKIEAGQPISTLDAKFAMDGVLTDYPFDRYRTRPIFQLLGADGQSLPTTVTIVNGDPFFKVAADFAADTDADPTVVDLDLRADRSTPTVVFALFIVILMLGLAIAAATAACYVLRGKRGLLWPACSMMAALLFALIPLRSAVPGSPPIGSVIDFTAFFLAEGIISVSLIASVLIGYRVQTAQETAEQNPAVSEPAAGK